jgi:geranylgeranyl diphosphate synthase type I
VTGLSYPVWSRDTFRTRIAPRSETADLLLDAECGPGPGAGQYRLFPGALFLLWTGAIGGPGASGGAEPVAAALEMLHNWSLVHDDVLDGHALRRGQPTLLGARGHNIAVLAGDALVARAMQTLGGLEAGRLPGVIARLANAAASMVAGQMNDEPDVWARVESREQHWLRVCFQKLALGNVSSSLAAFWCGRADLEDTVRSTMDEFSVVSQIINDFGDVLNFAGYHEIGVSGRPRAEESSRKPTLPLIWAGVDAWDRIDAIGPLYERAKREIACRKRAALNELSRLPLDRDFMTILTDFFTRPSLPELG